MPLSTLITKNKSASIPITLLNKNQFPAWLKKQSPATAAWIKASEFDASAGSFVLMPKPNGALAQVICGIEESPNVWSIAGVATKLPPQVYHLDGLVKRELATQLALGWALAGYRFTRYKKNDKKLPQLIAPKECDVKYVQAMVQAICWARDLINTPANDMHPAALAAEAVDWAKSAGGQVNVIKGEALLKANYPAIYTVGKAAGIPPHLVDIRFKLKGAPKVTLVGKGVCFDSGGLDLKPSSI